MYNRPDNRLGDFFLLFHIPFRHVVFDIFGYAVNFVLVAHDAVVKPRLPRKRHAVLVGVSGDGLFE